ncbi:MAG: glycogen debranching protein GlgX, partial [bacterium]
MEQHLEHRTRRKLSPGQADPLGATIGQDGVNFALYSRNAREVYLLLFDRSDGNPTDIIKMERRNNFVWHVFVHGITAGQRYGYKVKGRYDPAEGLWFNEYKLLIDPYAKALTHKFINKDGLLFPYDVNVPDDLTMDRRDNARIAPKGIVIDDTFDWGEDPRPGIPLEKLLIYEVHLKGFTAHSSSKVRHPGTYEGFIERIPHLKDLGINAVEFLPVHEFHVRDALLEKGLTEYWGYNTIGFFAPEVSYGTRRSPGCQVAEFKRLVRELHKAGIEVILDVVYNHTGEGDALGPTLCFKGIDNPTYYLLSETHGKPYREFLDDDTGCENTMNVENPQVLRLILDSLRYWVQEMHVDGFRFDLASILARVKGTFSKDSVFFDAVSRDPLLSTVKLIAEPWDLKTYQVGNFPPLWSEWNGRFRDTVRRFLRGDAGQVKDLAWRLTGSADLYENNGRSPHNSINYITCHDGFTLNDLFSFNQKHNQANGEANGDGSSENYSWNCGHEGATRDARIIKLRKQLAKNALCCVFFSLGTSMLMGGDEFLRTQKGNNNPYCQDNAVSWLDWRLLKKNDDVYAFCKKAIDFRKRYPVINRKRFYSGRDHDADGVPDIEWFGANLEPPPWDDPGLRFICYQLDGSEPPTPMGDYHLFFILNADPSP